MAARRLRAHPVLMESGFAWVLLAWSHFLDGEPMFIPGSKSGGTLRLKMR